MILLQKLLSLSLIAILVSACTSGASTEKENSCTANCDIDETVLPMQSHTSIIAQYSGVTKAATIDHSNFLTTTHKILYWQDMALNLLYGQSILPQYQLPEHILANYQQSSQTCSKGESHNPLAQLKEGDKIAHYYTAGYSGCDSHFTSTTGSMNLRLVGTDVENGYVNQIQLSSNDGYTVTDLTTGKKYQVSGFLEESVYSESSTMTFLFTDSDTQEQVLIENFSYPSNAVTPTTGTIYFSDLGSMAIDGVNTYSGNNKLNIAHGRIPEAINVEFEPLSPNFDNYYGLIERLEGHPSGLGSSNQASIRYENFTFDKLSNNGPTKATCVGCGGIFPTGYTLTTEVNHTKYSDYDPVRITWSVIDSNEEVVFQTNKLNQEYNFETDGQYKLKIDSEDLNGNQYSYFEYIFIGTRLEGTEADSLDSLRFDTTQISDFPVTLASLNEILPDHQMFELVSTYGELMLTDNGQLQLNRAFTSPTGKADFAIRSVAQGAEVIYIGTLTTKISILNTQHINFGFPYRPFSGPNYDHYMYSENDSVQLFSTSYDPDVLRKELFLTSVEKGKLTTKIVNELELALPTHQLYNNSVDLTGDGYRDRLTDSKIFDLTIETSPSWTHSWGGDLSYCDLDNDGAFEAIKKQTLYDWNSGTPVIIKMSDKTIPYRGFVGDALTDNCSSILSAEYIDNTVLISQNQYINGEMSETSKQSHPSQPLVDFKVFQNVQLEDQSSLQKLLFAKATQDDGTNSSLWYSIGLNQSTTNYQKIDVVTDLGIKLSAEYSTPITSSDFDQDGINEIIFTHEISNNDELGSNNLLQGLTVTVVAKFEDNIFTPIYTSDLIIKDPEAYEFNDNQFTLASQSIEITQSRNSRTIINSRVVPTSDSLSNRLSLSEGDYYQLTQENISYFSKDDQLGWTHNLETPESGYSGVNARLLGSYENIDVIQFKSDFLVIDKMKGKLLVSVNDLYSKFESGKIILSPDFSNNGLLFISPNHKTYQASDFDSVKFPTGVYSLENGELNILPSWRDNGFSRFGEGLSYYSWVDVNLDGQHEVVAFSLTNNLRAYTADINSAAITMYPSVLAQNQTTVAINLSEQSECFDSACRLSVTLTDVEDTQYITAVDKLSHQVVWQHPTNHSLRQIIVNSVGKLIGITTYGGAILYEFN
ncbi:hypothetical protein ACMZOO_17910 (plasmid) [Catenovulum sp. SX2]|uniref:hypothetical protein n=1 Tax=Catenovulum sp. SX2 TaxID=3398614 RepID=UPI003F874C84